WFSRIAFLAIRSPRTSKPRATRTRTYATPKARAFPPPTLAAPQTVSTHSPTHPTTRGRCLQILLVLVLDGPPPHSPLRTPHFPFSLLPSSFPSPLPTPDSC